MTAVQDLLRELERVKRLALDLHDPKSRAALSRYSSEIETSLDAGHTASSLAVVNQGAVRR
jgi:hypothetical protein